MDENTMILIEKFTETIKQYGGDLFIIAQKQLYVEVTQFVVIACITTICIMMSKKYLDNREPIDSYDLDLTKMIITVVICGLLLMLFVSLNSCEIFLILNFNYYFFQTKTLSASPSSYPQ